MKYSEKVMPVTDEDVRAALVVLQGRPDVDPKSALGLRVRAALGNVFGERARREAQKRSEG